MKLFTWLMPLVLCLGCTTASDAVLLRTTAVTWGDVQVAADQPVADWNWTAVEAVLANQPEPVIVPIYPYALWDQASCHSSWPSVITLLGEQFQAPYVPCDQAAYQSWLQALVARYGDQVAAWQVVVMPSEQVAPTADFIGQPSDYAALAVLTADTIHQANRTAVVYLGQLNNLSPTTVTFYTELLSRSDVQTALDGLTIATTTDATAVESILDRAHWIKPADRVNVIQE